MEVQYQSSWVVTFHRGYWRTCPGLCYGPRLLVFVYTTRRATGAKTN